MSLKFLKISARSSQLAKLQAYMVGDALMQHYPHLKIKYEFRESLGDKNLTDPLWKMPEKGVFTEDFYEDLVQDRTDMVVHSWKDLPVESKADTYISATLPRADQRDILILKKDRAHKKDIKIFTSSPRREYNLKPFFSKALPGLPDQISFHNIRGNVPTRLRKLFADASVDGLVLAKAAVDRFLQSSQDDLHEVQKEIRQYFNDNHWMVLPLSVNPNAAAQGALAIEIKNDREDLHKMLTAIHDEKTYKAAQIERQTLKKFGGGCHQKIGISCLYRTYGEIFFLKGITDQGKVLDEHKLTPQFSHQRVERAFKGTWSSSSLNQFTQRKNLNFAFDFEKERVGFFVSQIAAWTDDFHQQFTKSRHKHYVWAAGLETWKKLAQKGIWVNGSAESLGEDENKMVDTLSAKSSWYKISHDQIEDKKNVIMTYNISLKIGDDKIDEVEKQIDSSEIIYWTSPYYFSEMFKLFPQIMQKKHASGVGHTFKYLVSKFHIQPYLFLNEQEFKKL